MQKFDFFKKMKFSPPRFLVFDYFNTKHIFFFVSAIHISQLSWTFTTTLLKIFFCFINSN